jgi:CSLREA domain-containing protein
VRRATRTALALAVVALTLAPGRVSAATITVNTTLDGIENGGTCSLREAVEAANQNAAILGCAGDTAGADTILLQSGQTYRLTGHAAPEDSNASGDLDVVGGGGTTIRSTGPGLATIDADSTTVAGPADNVRGRAIDILTGAGAVVLERIRVTGGAATDSTGGGGIRTRAPLTLTESEVSGNTVGVFAGTVNFGGGGILVQDPGSLTLSRSTVAGNLVRANPASLGDSARGGGIAFFSSSGPLDATNSTISSNQVDSSGNTVNTTYAGGINWVSPSQTMTLTNVTISNNSAVGGNSTFVFGGGIGLLGAKATLRGTILAGNQAPAKLDCTQVNPTDDWISAGDNVIGDTSGCGHSGGGNDLFDANPNLGPLSGYGGPTRSQLPNPGSPAINHGGSCPTLDQRGFFRAPVAPCDAGAVEIGAPETLPPVPPPPTDPDNSLRFGKVTRNRRRGTAKLPVVVPGPGELELTGKGAKPRRVAEPEAGTAVFVIKAKGGAKKALRIKGRKKLRLSVTFTPTGGAPNTERTTVKLIRR